MSRQEMGGAIVSPDGRVVCRCVCPDGQQSWGVWHLCAVGGAWLAQELVQDGRSVREEVTDIYHLPKPLYFYRRHTDNATNRQLDVIHSSQRAINNALHRRGLDHHYHLSITATYTLSPKPSVPERPATPLQSLSPIALSPLVSIIIPAYNTAPRLVPCLQSCIRQTYPNLEILLVDNGSTDETVAIAERIAAESKRSIQILPCPQPGANHARNLGLPQTQGDYIQWLDADDDLAPDKLERQVIALVQHPEADLAYGDWDWCCWEQRQLIDQLCFADRANDLWCSNFWSDCDGRTGSSLLKTIK